MDTNISVDLILLAKTRARQIREQVKQLRKEQAEIISMYEASKSDLDMHAKIAAELTDEPVIQMQMYDAIRRRYIAVEDAHKHVEEIAKQLDEWEATCDELEAFLKEVGDEPLMTSVDSEGNFVI